MNPECPAPTVQVSPTDGDTEPRRTRDHGRYGTASPRSTLGRMRILITGAARAIGRATAEELIARGHDVVATARDPELLADLEGGRVHALDVTDDASVSACLTAAGDLDAVVNNAAIIGSGP